MTPSFPTISSNRFRSRSLASAGVALAGVSSPASATVISNLSQNSSPETTFSFDGSDDGFIKLFAMAGMMDDLDLGLEADGMNSSVELASDGGMGMEHLLSNLTVTDTVDGTLSFESDGHLVNHGDINPAWSPGSIGYAGFTFEEDGTNTVFGWLKIEFDSSAETFTVLQWAYQDDGSPIQVALIPEPSTVLLFTAGLAGLVGVRRRRRRQSARTGSPLP